MRVPNRVHMAQPWRIHELTRDFRLEDVWELPGADAPDAFDRIVQWFASFDPSKTSCTVSTLFAVREKLGELFGWDRPETGVGARVATLRDRLPADLRDGPPGPSGVLPFSSLYLTDDEWAVETANQTVHGVIHLGRVADANGGYRAYLAIYVKPNGMLGNAYIVAIKPFRYLIVYPSMLRQLERMSRAHTGPASLQEVPI